MRAALLIVVLTGCATPCPHRHPKIASIYRKDTEFYHDHAYIKCEDCGRILVDEPWVGELPNK